MKQVIHLNNTCNNLPKGMHNANSVYNTLSIIITRYTLLSNCILQTLVYNGAQTQDPCDIAQPTLLICTILIFTPQNKKFTYNHYPRNIHLYIIYVIDFFFYITNSHSLQRF